MKPRFLFENRGEVAEMSILGPIGGNWMGEGVTESDVKRALDEIDPKIKRLTITMDSPGGLVNEGFAIYNMLKNSKLDITVNVIGWAASAASVILMAADKRMVAETGMVMIHNGWGITIGNRKEHRYNADLLEKIDSQIAGVYASRSGKDVAKYSEWMDAETWFTGSEAVDAGLADGVIPNKGTNDSIDLDIKAAWAEHYANGKAMLARYRDLCTPKPVAAAFNAELLRARLAIAKLK